jgi:hypothetical protein
MNNKVIHYYRAVRTVSGWRGGGMVNSKIRAPFLSGDPSKKVSRKMLAKGGAGEARTMVFFRKQNVPKNFQTLVSDNAGLKNRSSFFQKIP